MNINFKNCWTETETSSQETGVFTVLIVSNTAKGRISKLVLQENRARQIFQKKQTFLIPWAHSYVCASEGKKCFLFGKFSLLCFLVTPVLRFAILPYYRQIVERECYIAIARKYNSQRYYKNFTRQEWLNFFFILRNTRLKIQKN